MADLHGRLPEVTLDCYAILLAGDLCPDGPRGGRGMDAMEHQAAWLDGPFRGWLERQSAPVIGIAGNHDFVFERPEMVPNLPWMYLDDSECEVNGLRVWGSPRNSTDMAFPRAKLGADWPIPAGVDVLITHQPPRGIGDRANSETHLGSRALLYRVGQVRPQLHIFGHVHEHRGHWTIGETLFVNCALPLAGWVPWGLADSSWRKHGTR